MCMSMQQLKLLWVVLEDVSIHDAWRRELPTSNMWSNQYFRSGGNCVRSDLFPTLLGLPFANDSSVGFSAVYLCEKLL